MALAASLLGIKRGGGRPGHGLAGQAGRDRGLRRRDPPLRPGHRAPGGGGRRPGRGAVADDHRAVRRLRHHGRPGHASAWNWPSRRASSTWCWCRSAAAAWPRASGPRSRRCSRGAAVIGVEPAGADDTRRSLRAGHRVSLDTVDTIADGLRAATARRAHVRGQPAAARRRRHRARRGDRRGHAVLLRPAQGGRRAQRRGAAGRPAQRAAVRADAGGRRTASSCPAATSTPPTSPRCSLRLTGPLAGGWPAVSRQPDEPGGPGPVPAQPARVGERAGGHQGADRADRDRQRGHGEPVGLPDLGQRLGRPGAPPSRCAPPRRPAAAPGCPARSPRARPRPAPRARCTGRRGARPAPSCSTGRRGAAR